MSPETLFIRDPREVPFLRDQVKKVLVPVDKASRSITIQENDDFGFMTIQFQADTACRITASFGATARRRFDYPHND
jgi:hypothetical protein